MKSWKEVVTVAIILLVLGFILWPVTHNGYRGMATHSKCISNVKNLVLATMIYIDDYDEKLPDRDAWMDLTKRYHTSKDYPFEGIVHCPAIEDKHHYGYALNSLVERIPYPFGETEAETPLIYESINLARNASDPLQSILEEGRHRYQSGVIVGFADGHAASKQPKWVKATRR